MLSTNNLYNQQNPIKLDLIDVGRYFKIDNRFIKKYSNNNKIYLNKPVVNALLKAKKDLPDNYSFIIMYGYRSLEEQMNIVKSTEVELKKSNPHNWEYLLNIYTGGYDDLKETNISFMNHRSGNAVDLKLIDGKTEVDLGGSEAQMKNTDNIDYYNRKHNLTPKEIIINNNRQLLKSVLTKHGFVNYKNEWWHWGYKPK